MHELEDHAITQAARTYPDKMDGWQHAYMVADNVINAYQEALTVSDPAILDTLGYRAVVLDKDGVMGEATTSTGRPTPAKSQVTGFGTTSAGWKSMASSC